MNVGKDSSSRFYLKLVCLSMILLLSTGCSTVKVVRIPIPIPTFGLGAQKKLDTTPTQTDEKIIEQGMAEGVASWYGPKFHGRCTSNGELFDMYKLTAAHRTLPFGTRVRVTNIENNKSIIVRINDRGPWVKKKERIIDLSRAAARELGFEHKGVAKVRIQIL